MLPIEKSKTMKIMLVIEIKRRETKTSIAFIFIDFLITATAYGKTFFFSPLLFFRFFPAPLARDFFNWGAEEVIFSTIMHEDWGPSG